MSEPERIDVGETWEEFQELVERRGWGDGLPLVPPTPERVHTMLGAEAPSKDESLGRVPPSWREATKEAVAVNAVMAGCLPEMFPVLCAAVSATLEPSFNLYGIQATTNPVAPLVVVNGPGRARLRLNGGTNAFGPGWRSNATLGRALRLVHSNIGDAKPWGNDRATHGYPAKFTFCAAENEEASPWEPLHVERGFTPTDTVVTVMAIQAFHNVVEFIATEPDEILASFAANMAVPGTNNVSYGGEPVLVIAPEHARLIGDGGLTKSDVKRRLFEQARCDLSGAPKPTRDMLLSRRPRWADLSNWPICDRAEDLMILVVGGPGTHAAFLPTFGPTTAVSRVVSFGPTLDRA
jgi:hypothetical protein